MKVYKKVYSTEIPNSIGFDEYHIYVYSDIKAEALSLEELNALGFKEGDVVYSFNITEYDKDEYLTSFTPERIGALPIEGGTLKGSLGVGNGYAILSGDSAYTELTAKSYDEEIYAVLQIRPKDYTISNLINLIHWDNSGRSFYKIFGDHLTTQGSYYGNGNGDRTIKVGGASKLLVIYTFSTNDDGYNQYDSFIIAGENGAVVFDNTGVTMLDSSYICFYSDEIRIAKHSDCINKQGIYYHYFTLVID